MVLSRRRTLLDPVWSQLPAATEIACHTAELTQESIANKALHLTAVQVLRIPKCCRDDVWESTDGPDLAGNF